MTKLYCVFVISTALTLEIVSARDRADAIARVQAMYPHHSSESLMAILIKKIETDPQSELE
jgi:predicted outer membrane lipoprotein